MLPILSHAHELCVQVIRLLLLDRQRGTHGAMHSATHGPPSARAGAISAANTRASAAARVFAAEAAVSDPTLDVSVSSHCTHLPQIVTKKDKNQCR